MGDEALSTAITLRGSLESLGPLQSTWCNWHAEMAAFAFWIVLVDVTSSSGGRLLIQDAAASSSVCQSRTLADNANWARLDATAKACNE